MDIDEVAILLREFQLVEWALDRRITKKAVKDQRRIVRQLLEAATGTKVDEEELDRVIGTMN